VSQDRIKKTGGGRKISVTPLGQNWDFSIPSDTKQDFFTPPRRYFFLVTPQTVLSNFTPLGQFFPPILPPSFFCQFTPLGQLILPPSDSFFHPFFPPQTFFRKCYTPQTTFLETPSDKNLQFFTPQVKKKDFQHTPGQGDLTPSNKKAIPPPFLFFLME